MKVFVVFGKRKNPWMILSPIICAVNHTPFSHTAILVEDEEGSWIYESTMPKSHRIPYSKWIEHYSLEGCHDITLKLDIEFFKPILNSMLGLEYSYSQLVMAGLSLLFHGIFRPKYLNGSRRLICSEYVALFLENACGIKFPKPNDYITLSDVFEASK